MGAASQAIDKVNTQPAPAPAPGTWHLAPGTCTWHPHLHLHLTTSTQEKELRRAGVLNLMLNSTFNHKLMEQNYIGQAESPQA